MNMKTLDTESGWLQELPSNAGSVTLLVPPMKSATETGLRAPYQYKTTVAKTRKLMIALKALEKKYSKQLQCFFIENKSTKYGCRLNGFFLGYRHGFCGDKDERGLTAEQWEEVVSLTKKQLEKVLPGLPFYIEPWQQDDKFQARFETYILYKELS